ncbi:PLDc N-terminal domain-containing protein [bacterium RCC_150]
MNGSFVTLWVPMLVLGACLGLWVVGLVDFSQTDEKDMRTFPKEVWLLILVLGSVVGGIAWLLGGRPQHPGVHKRP